MSDRDKLNAIAATLLDLTVGQQEWWAKRLIKVRRDVLAVTGDREETTMSETTEARPECGCLICERERLRSEVARLDGLRLDAMAREREMSNHLAEVTGECERLANQTLDEWLDRVYRQGMRVLESRAVAAESQRDAALAALREADDAMSLANDAIVHYAGDHLPEGEDFGVPDRGHCAVCRDAAESLSAMDAAQRRIAALAQQPAPEVREQYDALVADDERAERAVVEAAMAWWQHKRVQALTEAELPLHSACNALAALDAREAAAE